VPSAGSGDDSDAAYGRRARAVEAYCRELLGPETAATAANEILGSLTRAISDEAELLETTRTAAAERLTARSRWNPNADVAPECGRTPAHLAARANGTLDLEGKAQLETHLASCLLCRAAEVRAVRADRAFAGISGLALGTTRD
jgi:hypothetical protein